MAEPDRALSDYIENYQKVVDQKYEAIICKLAVEHTHPKREIETSLGNLIADAFAENAECDVMFVASGSIRSEKIGPMVMMKDIITCFPYDDVLTRYTITGTQLTKIFNHIMRIENRDGEGECYQVNSKVRAEYSDSEKRLISLRIDGKDVNPVGAYTICLQGYHAKNSNTYLGISQAELTAIKTKVVTTSSFEVLVEFLKNNQNIKRNVEGRLIYLK
jgi:5'-nucleotidase